MRAQITQEILVEVAGSFSRRKVVRAITPVRHRLESEICAGSVVSAEDMAGLVSICEELELTAFEVIEALGSTWATDRAHMTLTPEDAPIGEWDIWLEEHIEADLGVFEILGGNQ